MPTTLSCNFSSHLLGLAVTLFVATSGCSSGIKKVTVSGTVSYKGQPLQSGILKFVGPEGSYSAASVQPDGTFTVTDVVPGEIKVGIMESPAGYGSSSGDKKGPARPSAAASSLPQKYREPETSDLKYTITSDTKDLRIDIP